MTDEVKGKAKETAPEPVEAPKEEPKARLPFALVVAIVGGGLFLFGAFLHYYNGIPGDETPKLFNAMSGKIAIILILMSVLLVAIKRFQTLAAIAASLALGAVLQSVVDIASGDSLPIELSNAITNTTDASAGPGMYAALFGAIICLMAVFMVSRKKDKE